MYQCSDLLTLHQLGKIALLIHVKDDDRHITLAAKRKRCLVHDLETVLDSLVKHRSVSIGAKNVPEG